MKYLAILALVILSGCADMTNGTTQQIGIESSPNHAQCKIMRNGELVKEFTTPELTSISRTKYDLTISCIKDGYKEAVVTDASDTNSTTLFNVIAGGGVGWIVDSATGADNKYDPNIFIKLEKK